MNIQVEFFGVPRQRAGTDVTTVELDKDKAYLSDVLLILADRFPELSETCFDGGRLRSGFVANVDGRRFVTDPHTPLSDGESLLIMSADAGG